MSSVYLILSQCVGSLDGDSDDCWGAMQLCRCVNSLMESRLEAYFFTLAYAFVEAIVVVSITNSCYASPTPDFTIQ